MGWPVDLECAYRGGVLYLLQCRPITTLDGRRAAAAIPAASLPEQTLSRPDAGAN